MHLTRPRIVVAVHRLALVKLAHRDVRLCNRHAALALVYGRRSADRIEASRPCLPVNAIGIPTVLRGRWREAV